MAIVAEANLANVNMPSVATPKSRRIVWSREEEHALAKTFTDLSLHTMQKKPWSSLLQKIRSDLPGVLDPTRTPESLKDKARSLGLTDSFGTPSSRVSKSAT